MLSCYDNGVFRMQNFPWAGFRVDMIAEGMDGIFLLNKPRGPSSRKALNEFAKALPRGLKHGHAGTLDPLASGLLLVVTGKATRMIELYQEFSKVYEATVHFGATSHTDDSEGPIEEVPGAVPPDRDQLLEKLNSMVGELSQVPPAFSAVRIEGKRAYRLARSGKPKLPEPKIIKVYKFELLSHEGHFARIRWEVSSGTYIRSLARDLGCMLGTGAYLENLVRTSIGPWSLGDSLAPGDTPVPDSSSWIPLDKSLVHFPKLVLGLPRSREILGGKKTVLKFDEDGGTSNEGMYLLTSCLGQNLGLVQISTLPGHGVLVSPWKMFLHVGLLHNSADYL